MRLSKKLYCNFLNPENSGTKLEEAAALCDKDSEPGMRRRGKGKGKGKGKGQKKCPTVEEVWNKVQEEMGGEAKILGVRTYLLVQMSSACSSRSAGWMRATSSTTRLPWLTSPRFLRE